MADNFFQSCVDILSWPCQGKG